MKNRNFMIEISPSQLQALRRVYNFIKISEHTPMVLDEEILFIPNTEPLRQVDLECIMDLLQKITEE